jgi:hypothetical protein
MHGLEGWMVCYTKVKPIPSLTVNSKYEESKHPMKYTKLGELDTHIQNINKNMS